MRFTHPVGRPYTGVAVERVEQPTCAAIRRVKDLRRVARAAVLLQQGVIVRLKVTPAQHLMGNYGVALMISNPLRRTGHSRVARR